MARIPQVTRTIETTRVNVLCLNVESAEPFNKEVVLPRTYKSHEKLMEAVKKVVDNETVKAVHVVDIAVEQKLYGMSESDFIAMAHELPPREATNSTHD